MDRGHSRDQHGGPHPNGEQSRGRKGSLQKVTDSSCDPRDADVPTPQPAPTRPKVPPARVVLRSTLGPWEAHTRRPDSAWSWSSFPVGNSERPPVAAAGRNTESPPSGPGAPSALPAAATPSPPSWRYDHMPAQPPSPAPDKEGRREKARGAGPCRTRDSGAGEGRGAGGKSRRPRG